MRLLLEKELRAVSGGSLLDPARTALAGIAQPLQQIPASRALPAIKVPLPYVPPPGPGDNGGDPLHPFGGQGSGGGDAGGGGGGGNGHGISCDDHGCNRF